MILTLIDMIDAKFQDRIAVANSLCLVLNMITSSNKVSFTRFTSSNSNLSKRFFMRDGSLHKEAAAQMIRGKAERLRMPFYEFSQALESATSSQAFGYGVHNNSLPDVVGIVLSGCEKGGNNIIARTKEHFQYCGQGIMMLDHDPSPYGLNMTVGGFLDALEKVHPELAHTARFVRGSVSAGVQLTGDQPIVSKGFHAYFPVNDSAKLPNYGAALFDRLWLAGYGFIALAKNGVMLERSIIDSSVFSPERLDFVGKPVLGDGVNYTSPVIDFVDGGMLDLSTLPPLTETEAEEVANLKSKAKASMQVASEEQARLWRADKINEMVRHGVGREKAEQSLPVVGKGGAQDLYDDYVLHFSSSIGMVTISDVLADPQRFDEKTLADPIEGIEYGATTAKFYWNNGKPVINSFAHGQLTLYFLHSRNTDFEIVPANFRVLRRDYQLTELGNAHRLHDSYYENLKYVPEVRAWLHWRDGCWHWDLDGSSVRRLAADLHHAIYEDGSQNPEKYKKFASWAINSQKRSAIDNATALLRDFESLRLPLKCIDANAMLVGLDGGRLVLDLETGLTRSANPNDYITKSLAVNELGDAKKAIRWNTFLEQVFDGDSNLINWLQRWFGYLLTGCTEEQFFVFAYGLGANGKSVMCETIRFIMCDYARAISVETLTETKRQAGAATPDLVDLVGARFALSSETEDGIALAESLVKNLVGGDMMSVRKLHGAPFQFKPLFKLMMLGNHRPIIRGSDYGIWRRVRLIPFKRVFKPEERDPNLVAKLREEAPHILHWMVQGCINWQLVGLSDTPAVVHHATEEYRSEQDIIGQWLRECCEQSCSLEASSTQLYKSYERWCHENGLRPAANVSFGRRLGERGFIKRQSNGQNMWKGLTVNVGFVAA